MNRETGATGAQPRTPEYFRTKEGQDAFAARFAFLAEADRLKSIARANVLMDGSRPENSAEHSWHVALYGMVFGLSDRALAMILLHDLVEIDVGDHPIHLGAAPDLAAQEDAAAARLFGMLPDGDNLLMLWREFEAGQSDDARAAKRMDHIQPMFQVLLSPAPPPDHIAIVRDNMANGRAARLWDEWPEAMAAAKTLLDGGDPDGYFGQCLSFLAEADRLKSVNRAGLIHDGRRENSAEHSWHLALYALILAELAGPDIHLGRVIRMLILHDLVEIDTGDVPLHAAGGLLHHGTEQLAAEDAAATRIFGLLPPGPGQHFRALWDEFERDQTPDAIFAKALDRAQPVWLNICAKGGTWAEYNVSWDQLVARVGDRISRGSAPLWDWLAQQSRCYFNAQD